MTVRRLERGFFVLGFVLFAWLLHRFGWQSVVDAVRLAGWGLLAIVLQEIAAHLCNTLGWWWAFPRGEKRPPFSSLFAARMAGDATNYVTPTATLGGEFVRLSMLRGSVRGAPLAASLAVAKFAQTAGQIVFILLGLLGVALTVPLPPGLWPAIAASLGVMGAVVVLLLWWQRKGMFVPLLGRFGLLAGPRRAVLAERVAELDAQVRSVHRDTHGRVVLSVAAFAAGWAMGVVEMYLILWCLGLPASWSVALAAEVLSVTVDGLLFFLPAKIGAQEGGKVLIFGLLGLDPAKGFAAGVLRRVRELTWAALGMVLLVVEPGARRSVGSGGAAELSLRQLAAATGERAMAVQPGSAERLLIVSADDFGLSSSVNAGIVRAHREGLLTNASLMVNGAAFEEAVDQARSLPELGVGLHLVLLQGRAALAPSEISELVSPQGYFSEHPVATGIRYFFRSTLHPLLEREIRAQVEKFLATGLELSHIDGHLNIHMHPTVLGILVRIAPEYGIRAIRLPREPLGLSLRADSRERFRKVAESLTFRVLCRYAQPRLDAAGVAYPDRIFGLHHSGHMTEPYLRFLLEHLPEGVTELYTHASLVDAEAARWRPARYECEAELAALLSPALRQRLQELGIGRISYRELPELRKRCAVP